MKKKVLKSSLCIFIAIVLMAVAVVGLSYGIRNGRAVVKLGDITVDWSTITYLASFHKMSYLQDHDHDDSGDNDEFWSSPTDDGITHAEDFENRFKEYIKKVVAEAYLYVTHCGYTPEDKLQVAQNSDSVLREYANGSIAEFNEVAKEYGFNYNDFQNADALLYKAKRAREILPDMLGAEEYERQLAEAILAVSVNSLYDNIDIISVPLINDYYYYNE